MASLMLLLLALVFGALLDGTAPVRAEPPFQDGTGYPGEETQPPPNNPDPGNGYPGETPPAGGQTVPAPTLENTPDATLEATITLTPTETEPPNIFQTENAEMGGGNVTPPPSETPGPTITPYISATPTRGTAQPTITAAVRKTDERKVDWGLFWIGFSIPVLSACGLVLYLLDQRPDLFRPRKK